VGVFSLWGGRTELNDMQCSRRFSRQFLGRYRVGKGLQGMRIGLWMQYEAKEIKK